MWERTYEIETPPSAPMSWEGYERLIVSRWSELLESSPAELSVHEFLEQHPSMVPGAFNIVGGDSGHFPWLSALVSKPALPSFDRRIPDFMWLSLNSEVEEPVLIEIEAPSKRWFTASGEQTAHLTQALGQIAEWKAWFGTPRNVDAFKAFYKLDSMAYLRRRFRPAYLLIYGRRAEANASPRLTNKRGYLHGDDIVTMTFDRLRPNAYADQMICIKADGQGRLHAIAVPPTLRWIPSFAAERSLVQGLPAAIEANAEIGPERKEFLIRRLPYWNAWASKEPRGMIASGDHE